MHAHKLLSDIVFAATLFRGHLNLDFWWLSNLSGVMPQKKYEASPLPSPLLCTNTQVTCLDGQQTQMGKPTMCLTLCKAQQIQEWTRHSWSLACLELITRQNSVELYCLVAGLSALVNLANYKVKKMTEDFSGDPAVKNPPRNSEDVGSSSGWGTWIPHTSGLLSPWVTAREKLACHN